MQTRAGISKVCVVCGTDVASQKRVKDASGRYYCSGCYEAATAGQKQPASEALSVNPAPASVPLMASEPTSAASSPSSGASTAKAGLLERLKPLWARRGVRLGVIAGGCLLVALVIGLPILAKIDADRRAYVNRQIEENYRKSMKNAESIGRQAAREQAEADQMRAKAAELRGAAAAADDDHPASKTTKSQAIASSRYMSTITDEHPDLLMLIKRGGTLDGSQRLSLRLNLLLANNVLNASQVRYIQQFARDIQSLPD